MSIFSGKKVLFVGSESDEISRLKDVFQERGLAIAECPCTGVTKEILEAQSPDFILLNLLDEAEQCRSVFTNLRNHDVVSPIPVFSLVPETNEAIESALEMGSTDYITANESPDSVMQKVETLFQQHTNLGDTDIIDLTPEDVKLNTTGIRVFFIEDDPLLRNLLATKLKRSGLPYAVSTDGHEVIPALRQFNPDIILLDLMLPGRSGFDVLAEIKRNKFLKDVPVLVFSNRDGNNERTRATELGAAGFYIKAMTDLSELITMIEQYVTVKK